MTSEEKIHIQQETKDQAGSNTWLMKCRKWLRASVTGGIVKMRITMKGRRLRIYCTVSQFKHSHILRPSSEGERQGRISDLPESARSGLKVDCCGLFVSVDNPWLIVTPNGLVTDPGNTTDPLGLLEKIILL